MANTRKEKIDALINYAKTILPQIETQITKEMQEELNEIYGDYDKKPLIDQNVLKERVKEKLISKVREHALKEFMVNRKTLSEYVQIVLLKLGYE